MLQKKVMSVFGTRPEAIKMAPLVKGLEMIEEFESIVTVTAQHREMLDQVMKLFDIEPQFDLNVMKQDQTLVDITNSVLRGLTDVFNEVKPDIILVHGDTTTTFAASLAAFYQKIKIGHIEAGLRTGNKYSPYPEEINRHMTGILADLHFAPTSLSKENLLKENIGKKNIFVTGNTVIDALLSIVDDNFTFNNEVLNKLDFANKKIVLLTSHRRENLGKPMENIFNAVRELVIENQDIELVFPVHLNPKVREIANYSLKGIERVHLIEPLDYQPFANLMARSYFVLTDSGGIQEEAPGLGKPVLVLRDTTERPEAVAAGTVKLVGTDSELIYKTADSLIKDRKKYEEMANAVNPYGDGNAVKRIINRLVFEFGFSTVAGEEYRS
ncbi:MAG: non-hydrolyzing UDP-N-acetylglucosamine 2-epimerase [Halanaerobiaceae bacterium]